MSKNNEDQEKEKREKEVADLMKAAKQAPNASKAVELSADPTIMASARNRANQAVVQRNMKEVIPSYFNLTEKDVTFVKKESGEQKGTIAIINPKTDREKKYYVKTYDNSDVQGLDPREFFVYKVLQLVDFGPEVEFIPSSKQGSFHVAYIATLDAGHVKSESEKGQEFKTMDNFLKIKNNQGDYSDIKEDLKHKISTNKDLAVQCRALEILESSLDLRDTFSNIGNYGFIIPADSHDKEPPEKRRKTETADKPDIFGNITKPRLIDFKSNQQGERAHGDRELTAKITGEEFLSIEQEAKDLLKKLDIPTVLDKAYQEVREALFQDKKVTKSLFIDKASEKLDQYKDTISKNFSKALDLDKKEDMPQQATLSESSPSNTAQSGSWADKVREEKKIASSESREGNTR